MNQSITIHDLYVSQGHDFKGRHGKDRLEHGATSVESVECVAGKGVEGDRYFNYKDDYKGQTTFIALEAIHALETELGISIDDHSAFRRNAVVSGIDLNTLVGRTFILGEAMFVGSEQCKPCYWMDQAIGAGALAAMESRGGLRCRILKSGTLNVGEMKLQVLD